MGGRVARTARTWLVVLGVVAAFALLPAAPAAAHNSLTGSDPRDGARLAAAPERIELRFLATPKEATTEVTVTGPDNVAAAGGAPTFSGKRVTVPFRPGAAGLYIVTYRLASDDGHPIKGEIRFTLTTGTPAEAPSASAPPTSAAPAAPTSAAPSPTPAPAEADDDGGTGWLWAAGAVVVLAALGGGLLLRRRAARR
ncbi:MULTISPECIES: copper resistance CopC family protein [unclassified Micromonospora]|uniref:copper resistance CopC family protein n=1 Tax=unclassified Micromonospora TaxID=2617518 RepID=UPI0003EEDB9E|nr:MULTISPECIES: copper resistance CopC family protein [unclassified Micromonospora]EWM68278.1 copper resistance protein CopC [Micromonospora sp. M42]MCK1808621.1 copper resistance protein CopC [Micromonospora sp. R42106]MCK1831325.1 copper resistance protein CopC [Micromonospora sp. R42003]MCK1845179.1 copper resistance protein CopC [Micromonospora sp. R42004]MCM1018316.1 copper resistance protein CopC [Micromonospora sp. XM-20-01]